MHWTAFLAYRRFPANARVVEDMACIGCGYNLRGLSVWARCPECGREAGNSLFLLAKPEFVGRQLRTAAWSHLCMISLACMCLGGAWWPWLVASGVLSVAGVFRVFAVSELRFRAALARLPIVGHRLHLWWISVIVELGCALTMMTCVLIVAYAPRFAATGAAVLGWLLVLAWLMTMLSAFCAGRFGYAMVDMIGFTWTRIEFRIHRWLVLGLMGLGLLCIITIRFAPLSPPLQSIISATVTFTVIAASTITGIALLHAATAAEQSQETIDEVLESERVAVLPDPNPQRPSEPPAIGLDA